MLPQTVGELRERIKDLPDSMKFDVDVNSAYGIHEASLDVEEVQIGYDGTNSKPIRGKALVLSLNMDA